MAWLETLVGTAAIVAIVACMPGMSKYVRLDQPPKACAAPVKRAPLLCNRVLADGSAECAICDEPNRSCMSSTHVYCAASCDDPKCVARGGQ